MTSMGGDRSCASWMQFHLVAQGFAQVAEQLGHGAPISGGFEKFAGKMALAWERGVFRGGR